MGFYYDNKTISKYFILVVDDDERIRKLISKFLKENNFLVMSAKAAEDARDLLKEFKFDLLILDVMMPKESGVNLAKNLRQNSDVPILMLSALAEADHRIYGLENGADDYMAKPFEPRELLIRIKNIIQRSNLNKNKNIVKIGDMNINLETQVLTKGNKNIILTNSQSKLLTILAKNLGNVMSRNSLGNLLGGLNERSIDVQIIRLRNKIEVDSKRPRYLHTIRNEGYVLYGD